MEVLLARTMTPFCKWVQLKKLMQSVPFIFLFWVEVGGSPVVCVVPWYMLLLGEISLVNMFKVFQKSCVTQDYFTLNFSCRSSCTRFNFSKDHDS